VASRVSVRGTRAVYRHNGGVPRGEQYSVASSVTVRVTCSVYRHDGGAPRGVQ